MSALLFLRWSGRPLAASSCSDYLGDGDGDALWQEHFERPLPHLRGGLLALGETCFTCMVVRFRWLICWSPHAFCFSMLPAFERGDLLAQLGEATVGGLAV